MSEKYSLSSDSVAVSSSCLLSHNKVSLLYF